MDSVSGSKLLVFVSEMYIIGLLMVLFLSHINTTLAFLVLKNFLLNRSKIITREQLMIGNVLVR